MEAYYVEPTVQQDGTLTVSSLLLQAGKAVEVIILVQSWAAGRQDLYPLWGSPITYINPTKPVAQVDWEAAR
jgi:hypothetical protein